MTAGTSRSGCEAPCQFEPTACVQPGDRGVYVGAWLTIVLVALGLRVGLLFGAASIGRDAAEHYLPLAAAVSQGRYAEAFDSGIPPLYPLVGGLLGRVVVRITAFHPNSGKYLARPKGRKPAASGRGGK